MTLRKTSRCRSLFGATSGPPFPSNAVKLKTVNWNLFLRWTQVTGLEGQDERAGAIAGALAQLGDVDVVTFEESWCGNDQILSGRVMCGSSDTRQILRDGMKNHGWIYSTNVVDDPGASVFYKQSNGGAVIFSKWPIVATSQYVYKTCSGSDCHAAKGAVYARIEKPTTGKPFCINIIATHLQAWSTPEGAKSRAGQLNEIMKEFVPRLGLHPQSNEPLIFQGDMNIDEVLYPEERDNMLMILHAETPPMSEDSLPFSSDPSRNFLVGKDSAAQDGKCLAAYKDAVKESTDIPSKACRVPKTTASGKNIRSKFMKNGRLNIGTECFCPCCPSEFLDYILYSTNTKFLQPTVSTQKIVDLKSPLPLTYKWGWCSNAGCLVDKKEDASIRNSRMLSDHFPVVAEFTFSPTGVGLEPDGCKTDEDCTLGLRGCLCRGKGCTLNGKRVDGREVSSVNTNCHFRTSQTGTCLCRPGNR